MKIKKHPDSFFDQIVQFFSTHVQHSYTSKQLAKRLRIKKADFKKFRRILRDLSQQGKIYQVEEGIFQASPQNKVKRIKDSSRFEERKQSQEMQGVMQQ